MATTEPSVAWVPGREPVSPPAGFAVAASEPPAAAPDASREEVLEELLRVPGAGAVLSPTSPAGPASAELPVQPPAAAPPSPTLSAASVQTAHSQAAAEPAAEPLPDVAVASPADWLGPAPLPALAEVPHAAELSPTSPADPAAAPPADEAAPAAAEPAPAQPEDRME
eukprot:2422062-Alexandrium_andersonii.AAC.1